MQFITHYTSRKLLKITPCSTTTLSLEWLKWNILLYEVFSKGRRQRELLYTLKNCLVSRLELFLGTRVMVCQSQNQASNGLTVSPLLFVTLPPPFEHSINASGEQDTTKESLLSRRGLLDLPTKNILPIIWDSPATIKELPRQPKLVVDLWVSKATSREFPGWSVNYNVCVFT